MAASSRLRRRASLARASQIANHSCAWVSDEFFILLTVFRVWARLERPQLYHTAEKLTSVFYFIFIKGFKPLILKVERLPEVFSTSDRRCQKLRQNHFLAVF
jgi:hypothetical protein